MQIARTVIVIVGSRSEILEKWKTAVCCNGDFCWSCKSNATNGTTADLQRCESRTQHVFKNMLLSNLIRMHLKEDNERADSHAQQHFCHSEHNGRTAHIPDLQVRNDQCSGNTAVIHSSVTRRSSLPSKPDKVSLKHSAILKNNLFYVSDRSTENG